MEYLTAAEMSKRWNVSSRMAAYYCEAGRINGAVKKGKVWLIPADTPKPPDKRHAKRTVQSEPDLQGAPYHSSENGLDTIYHTGDVYHNLGLTRETLRYYEEIGLIRPKRSSSSQYREFDLFDMSRLMAIDFFKKRGFTPAEIRELQNAVTAEEYNGAMQEKINYLHRTIHDLTKTLDRLEKTRDFFSRISDTSLEFTIRELPPYCIQDTISSVAAFHDYRDKVLCRLNDETEDILSNLVRVMTFDETGYKTSGMLVVKQATGTDAPKHEARLAGGRCLYTTLTADNDDTSVLRQMFSLCHGWARQHNASFRGVVYIFIRFVTLQEQKDRHFYEVWVPLQD